MRRVLLHSVMFVSVLYLVFSSSLAATAPRVTLDNFEKDLQTMAKSSASVAIKEGSFVDRLATKRRHKEIIDKELAQTNDEIVQLKNEVCLLNEQNQDLEKKLAQETKQLEERIAQVEQVVAQLETEQKQLRHETIS